MKNILFILLLSVTNLNAQASVDSTYEARFQKLKSLYIKMLDSESFHKMDSVLDIYTYKIHYKEYQRDIEKYNNMNDWVKANLEKTDYANFSEAEVDYNNMLAYQKESDIENSEYEDYLVAILLRKEGSEMFYEMLKEVVYENPQRFKKSDPRSMLKFKPRD
jgi:hypothetical protein